MSAEKFRPGGWRGAWVFAATHLLLAFLAAGLTSFAASMLGMPSWVGRLVFMVGVVTVPLSLAWGYRRPRNHTGSSENDEVLAELERKVGLLEEERDFYRALSSDAPAAEVRKPQ